MIQLKFKVVVWMLEIIQYVSESVLKLVRGWLCGLYTRVLSGGQSGGQYPRVNKTRTVRRIRHVEFLGQSAGQYPHVNKTRTVRRTVQEIMQIIAVNQALTFGRWVIEFLVLASLFRHAFLL
jgi:hypothetical protein